MPARAPQPPSASARRRAAGTPRRSAAAGTQARGADREAPVRAGEREPDQGQRQQRQQRRDRRQAQRADGGQPLLLRQQLGAADRGDAGPLPRANHQVEREAARQEVQAQPGEDLADAPIQLEQGGDERPQCPARRAHGEGQRPEQRRRRIGQQPQDQQGQHRAEHHLALNAQIVQPGGEGQSQAGRTQHQRGGQHDRVGDTDEIGARAEDTTEGPEKDQPVGLQRRRARGQQQQGGKEQRAEQGHHNYDDGSTDDRRLTTDDRPKRIGVGGG